MLVKAPSYIRMAKPSISPFFQIVFKSSINSHFSNRQQPIFSPKAAPGLQDCPRASLASIFNLKAANQKMPPQHTAKASPISKFQVCCKLKWHSSPPKSPSTSSFLSIRCWVGNWHGYACQGQLLAKVPLSVGIAENRAYFLQGALLQVPTQRTGLMVRGSQGAPPRCPPPGPSSEDRADAERLPQQVFQRRGWVQLSSCFHLTIIIRHIRFIKLIYISFKVPSILLCKNGALRKKYWFRKS